MERIRWFALFISLMLLIGCGAAAESGGDAGGVETGASTGTSPSKDSGSDSSTATTTSTTETSNSSGSSLPIADAGIDQNVKVNSIVTLDGSGTNITEGETITYSWSFLSHPETNEPTLSDAAIVNPFFSVTVEGTYLLGLIVNNGESSSVVDTVYITASVGNSPPIANAGRDKNVVTGSGVSLDGRGSSDADSNPITFLWSMAATPSGSSAVFNNRESATPQFTPDLDGEFVVGLTVNDGISDSLPDYMTITAATGNSAPVANAGSAQAVAVGSTVTLDGRDSSDANNDALTFQWTISSKPDGSSVFLSDTTSSTPSFTTDEVGSYVIGLIVNDGVLSSENHSVVITVTAYSIPLSWNAPTVNSDNSALTDLAGYKIYYGTTSGNYSDSLDVLNVTNYTLTGLFSNLTYFITVRAYDTAENESSNSSEVSQ